ncbi:hypothetical protein PPL_05772 [Heterostelium album PN500]|uniref:ABC transporter domain-containing protein n=1 Tax=Heterostelium pallidum (strain ATCC 26659 / Pp 5 / PN500) TaxID=670386 RepID=D3BB40_HETP5|nr:hypothetical protein PPL_05772 [Heterostelium album PN500]EFA81777.1 hypothetical protein PPL_05772 [Heterostelium album PN500]|eukprot:XP_020433894.1 hypothetical protein PPL_05772 [Heterostelium album PN500]
MPIQTFNEYCTQLKLLIKKNLLLKKKNKCGLVFEFLVPTVIIIILFIVLLIVKEYNKEYPIESIVALSAIVNSTSTILYGPLNNMTKEHFGVIEILKSNTVMTSGNIVADHFFIPFNNQLEMDNYFESNAESVLCGIWMNESSNANDFAYSIRMDSVKLPDTTILYKTKLSSTLYTFSNFQAVQLAMDASIMQYYGVNLMLNASTKRYPNPLDEEWQVWNEGRRTVLLNGGAMFLTAAFAVYVFRLTNDLVIEKETKIKEGMRMMGMRDSTYYQSFLISSLMVSLPILFIMFGSLVGSEVIYHANKWVFFFILFFYLLSLLVCSIIYSIFFDRSRYSGVLSYAITMGLGGAGIYVAQSSISRVGKGFLSLISPIGFACAIYSMVIDDMIDLRNENPIDRSLLLTPSQSLGILIFDILFDAILLWYFDNVWRGEYGTPRPMLFFLKKSYWFPSAVAYVEHPPIIENDMVETVSDDLKQNISISIRNLKRDFNTKMAVDGLSLDMYQNMIHAFLGHNGAGKSTTIGILTGLIRASDGDAYIHGMSITNEMSNIRRKLGVCPQHDIVWNQLTVLEHLEIYAALKGVENSSVESEAINMAKMVGLGGEMNSSAGKLSAGQKRKLCLGIAFIGRSEVILIDEVTSGMDPKSRREVWDFLHAWKQGRTIILTTHYMDEADNLADRIAIISKGKLRCEGSSLFLKKKFGLGYLLTLTKMTDCQTPMVTEFIQHFIPDCVNLSDAGSELSYRIPTHAADSFPIFFKSLDEQKHLIGIEHYGISLTTLEEVFLQIANEKTANTENNNSPVLSSSGTTKISIDTNSKKLPLETLMIAADHPNNYLQMFGLFVKKYRVSKNDYTMFMLANIGPWMLISLAIICLKFVKIQPLYVDIVTPITFDFSQYSGLNGLPNYLPIQTVDGNLSLLNRSPYFNQVVTVPSDINMDQYLRDNHFLDSAGSLAFNQPIGSLVNYTVYYNNDYPHASPTVMNVVNSAILEKLANVSIVTGNFPFKHVANTIESFFGTSNFSASSYFIILAMAGYSFMIASFGASISAERETQLKSILYVSGCKKYIYWLSNLMWDTVTSIEICLIIIGIYSVDHRLNSNIGLLIMAQSWFCLGTIPLSYLMSYNYTKIGKAFGAIYGKLFGVGLLFMAVGTWTRVYVHGQYFNYGKDLVYLSDLLDCIFYLISPVYCLGHIFSFILQYPGSLPPNATVIPSLWSMDQSGLPLFFLSLHFLVWSLIVLLIDYRMEIKGILKSKWKRKAAISPEPPSYEDPDVAMERIRLSMVLEKGEYNDSVILKELHKTFPTKGQEKMAVYNTSLVISPGEIFGLLGLTGAGKTTTLSLLAGDIQPTAGTALINGFDLTTQRTQALESVGICIQGDSLIQLLTGREHLRFYARIKGIPHKKIESVIKSYIISMDLLDIADELVRTYSGGNKRKLALCLALIGSPSVLFIDEASSGCDPQVRRLMWNLISQMSKSKKIILTTHSMEECEALCQRVAIMKCGRLMCLGSNQHIKSRFCSGYSLDIKFKTIAIEQGVQEIMAALPTAQLVDSHDLIANFEIPDGHLQVWQIFQVVQQLSQFVEDYSVSQTGVEQVFLKLTSDYFESHYLIYANQPIANNVYTEFYPPNFTQSNNPDHPNVAIKMQNL